MSEYDKITLVVGSIMMEVNCARTLGQTSIANLSTGCPVLVDAGIGFTPGIRFIRFDWYTDHIYIHELYDYTLVDGQSYSAGRYLNAIVGTYKDPS